MGSEVGGRPDELGRRNADDGEPDEWERMLALNVLTPMRLTRRLAPSMIERGRGTIINVGSVAAIEAMQSAGAYAASKFALRGWSLSCYQRLRDHGKRIVGISAKTAASQILVKQCHEFIFYETLVGQRVQGYSVEEGEKRLKRAL